MKVSAPKRLVVGLVYDLRKDYLAAGFSEEQVAEFDAEETIAALEKAICAAGYVVERIGNGRELCRRLGSGDRWDLVFNIAEGVKGRSREAQVPALLEMFEIPYVFSDPLVCAVSLDKATAKRLVGAAGLPTARFCVIEHERDVAGVNLGFPLFAKPIAEGTGKGVDHRSRIMSQAQLRQVCRRLLRRYAQPVLVEEYLPGREFTTGILGTGRAARVLGTMEVIVKENAPTQDYSFEVKEHCERFVDYLPMKRDRLGREVENLALAAYRAMECRDAGRVDIRLDRRGQPVFMEINPLPGLNPGHSDLPMIAAQAGLTYEELIAAILRSALARRTKAHNGREKRA